MIIELYKKESDGTYEYDYEIEVDPDRENGMDVITVLITDTKQLESPVILVYELKTPIDPDDAWKKIHL